MAKKLTFVRLTEEDKSLLQEIARFYGISEADVLRIALKEFSKNHGFGGKEGTEEERP